MTKAKKPSLIQFTKIMLSEPEKLSHLIGGSEDIFPYKLPPMSKLYIALAPAYIKHVFFENGGNYVRDPKLFRGFNDLFGKYGFETLDVWDADKKYFWPLFQKEKLIESVPLMSKAMTQQLNTWNSYVESNTPIYIDARVSEMTLENLLIAFFDGVHLDLSATNVLVRKVFYLMSPFVFPYVKLFGVPMPLYFRYQNVKRQVREMGLNIVKQSLNYRATQNNIIQYLANGYQCQSFEQLDAERLEHFIARAGMFIVAAYDSVSGTLVRALSMLSLYPAIADKVYDEVNAVLNKREPNYSDLQNLTYTRAVIKETMRLYPPNAGIVRTCIGNDKIGNYQIKKGDVVLFPACVTHKLLNYWDNPEGFDPTRFFNPLTEDQKLLYMPFALGKEACIGGQFATVQLTLALSMIAQRYRLFLTAGSSLKREKGLMNRLHQDLTMNVVKI